MIEPDAESRPGAGPAPGSDPDHALTAGSPASTAPTDGTTPPADPVDPPLPPRRIALFAAVAIVVLALDVISKVVIVANVTAGEPHRLIGRAVYLLLTRNSGAAFSLGGGATIILTAIAVAVVVVIIRTARRLRSVSWAIALGLILGGALGNLIDRLFRAPGIGRGHVVDWISVFSDDGSVWPIFNLADSAIVCGGILAAVIAMLGIEFDGRRAAQKSTRRESPARRG